MLENSLKEQVRQIFAELDSEYIFKVKVGAGHESRAELLDLLKETAECSSKLSVIEEDGPGLEFSLVKDGKETNIAFKAVPSGHEYSSLLLAVLNADGKGKNLPDPSLQKRIEAIKGKVHIVTYMSLSCTNCPDVVQSLNVIALLNENITHTVIDGALHPDEAEKMKVQAVPSVFSDGKLIHVGRSHLGELVEKLEAVTGTVAEGSFAPEQEFDVIVAGGGPAGSSAAIYSARKGLKVGIVAGRIGGQVNETVGIENVISVPHTTGSNLAADLRKHIESYDIKIFDNRTIDTFFIENGNKILKTAGGEIFKAPALIIATGASWRKLNVPGESEYIGRGVAFCPHCDGPFYAGKHVIVIGGGNSGIEAAIDLSGICSKVTVLEFMENLKADTVLCNKLFSLPNVEVFTNVRTMEVVGNGEKVVGVKVENRATGEERIISTDGIFVQIGLTANSSVFKDKLEVNRIGEIISDRNCRTSIKGVYAAGDVSDVSYKQIIISMGEGAKAALAAFDDRIRGELN